MNKSRPVHSVLANGGMLVFGSFVALNPVALKNTAEGNRGQVRVPFALGPASANPDLSPLLCPRFCRFYEGEQGGIDVMFPDSQMQRGGISN